MKKWTIAVLVFFFLYGCSNPEGSFQKAEKARSKELFEVFLKKYPDSEFAPKAETNISDIERWELIKNNTEKESLEAYLNDFKNGLFKMEAEKQLKELIDFETSRKTDTIEAYNSFLQEYSGSGLSSEASERIAELQPAQTAFNAIADEINTEVLAKFAEEFNNTGYSAMVAKKIETINGEHPIYPAEFLDLENYGRFAMHQEDNEIVFGVDDGFYGTYVDYDDGGLLRGVFAVGAQYVITGDVMGFFGYRLSSDTMFPLTLQAEKEGLRYVCGKGSITGPDGVKHEFGSDGVLKWKEKLQKGDVFQRRAAAQALGWIGGEDRRDLLLTALKDEDDVVKCLVVESLMRIGDPGTVEALKTCLEDSESQLDKRTSARANGMYYSKFEASTEIPLDDLLEARFKMYHRGITGSGDTAFLNKLVLLLRQAVSEMGSKI